MFVVERVAATDVVVVLDVDVEELVVAYTTASNTTTSEETATASVEQVWWCPTRSYLANAGAGANKNSVLPTKKLLLLLQAAKTTAVKSIFIIIISMVLGLSV